MVKFKISDFVPYLAMLASIRMIELKNTISHEQPMSLIYMGAPVCAFIIYCMYLSLDFKIKFF